MYYQLTYTKIKMYLKKIKQKKNDIYIFKIL